MYYLRYEHPAAYIFESDKTYSLDELKDQYKLSIDFIKELFVPLNFSWDDIESEQTPIKIVDNAINTESTEVEE